MLPLLLRILLILSGIGLLVAAVFSYSYKKLKEGFLLGWSLFALFLILLGTIPVLFNWSRAFCSPQYLAPAFLFVLIIIFLFKLSEYVSILSRKNQELAMHVSLLNQENERILLELQHLTGKSKTEL